MAGAKWDDFEIVDRLGVGGMAEVFLAHVRGAGGFQKNVVLKRALPGYHDDDELIAMFLDEARLAAKLMHPNVAAIYELGSGEGGYFYVMEYVDGIDLSDLLSGTRRRGVPVPPHFAVFICAQLAEALAYAHAATDAEGQPLGIVHRDVSPHNILLGKSGAVKLTDFGVARSNEQTTKTKTGALKGKMSYMSPEQLQGLSIDGRSDLFSLGVVLFELFAQRQPYTLPGLVPRLQAMLDEAWPNAIPDHITIPSDVADIIGRCLHQDPQARYADATAVLRALQRVMAQNEWFTSGTELGTYIQETMSTPLPTFDEVNDRKPSARFDQPGEAVHVTASQPVEEKATSHLAPPGLLVSRIAPLSEGADNLGLADTAAHEHLSDESLFSSDDAHPTRSHAVNAPPQATHSAESEPGGATVVQSSPLMPPRTDAAVADSELPTLVAGMPATIGQTQLGAASDTTLPPSQTPFNSEISSFGDGETAPLPLPHGTPAASTLNDATALPPSPTTARSAWLLAAAMVGVLVVGAVITASVAWPTAADIDTISRPAPVVAGAAPAPKAPSARQAVAPEPQAQVATTDDARDVTARAASPSASTRTKHKRTTKRRRSERAAKPAAATRTADKPAGRSKAAQAKAFVTLNSIPWAKVFVDGNEVGITPLLNVPLSPGERSIRFYSPQKKKSKTMKMTVKPGERRRIQNRF